MWAYNLESYLGPSTGPVTVNRQYKEKVRRHRTFERYVYLLPLSLLYGFNDGILCLPLILNLISK